MGKKVIGGKGTVNIVSSNVQLGASQPLLSASFPDESDVYTINFSLNTANVLPIPTPSPIWPPPPSGIQPPLPTIPQPTGGNQGVRCIATCVFSVDGINVQRIIDVGSGATISLCCDAVTVTVADATFTVSGPNNLQYNVSATVTRGVRPSVSYPPSLYGQEFSIVPLGTAVLAVPPDAGVVSVMITCFDDTTASVEPVFLRVRHKIGAFINAIYSAVLETGFVKIAPGTTSIELVNFSATDTVSAAINFGIDG